MQNMIETVMEVEIVFVQDQKPYMNYKIDGNRAEEEKCLLLNNAYTV
jgi:hypothetical protein